ncbi:MAG: hypothetical protein KAW12_13380 [Candidatus Aminicenantes bacterium]|nr:hypothetical protein [Candidatus Aminicenantes bacterium]
MARTSQKFPGVEWTGDPGDFIKIDKEKCTGCTDCIKVCLAGCFKMEKNKAVIVSLAECMECSSCWYVCTDEAIIFSWPPGGTGFRTEWG